MTQKKNFDNDENLKDQNLSEAEKMIQSDTDAGLLEEAGIESPGKIMAKKFFSNKLGVLGLIGFIAIFLLVFGGSILLPYDPYYSQPVLKNLAPGYGYMNYPQALLDEGVEDIQVGSTFAAGLSKEGNVYTWGHQIADNYSPPEGFEENQGSYEHILVGDKHIIAVNDQGEFFGWGMNNFSQADYPQQFDPLIKEEGIQKMSGDDMYSVILTDEGTIRVWGSTLPTNLNLIDPALDGQVEDFVTGTTNILLLLKDGSLRVIGQRGTEIETNMPQELKDGTVNVELIGRMEYSGIAVDDEGQVYTWGSASDRMDQVPDMEGNIVSLASGKEHVTALTDTGRVYSWGTDNYDSTLAPEENNYQAIYAGYFNNYAESTDQSMKTWGLNGFILGSDDQGRDMLTRIIHGGKTSLVVAFVSVVVQVILGTLIGIIAGYYGGQVDNFLMRLAEIVSSFPFYPLIITLSAILPVDMSQNQRLMMIMLILGLINWPSLARLVRAEILSVREQDYITASKALGLTESKIMVTHILPNIISIIIVQATVGYATNLLVEASLSFVGFGVRPPYPSWGNILADGNNVTVLENYWWRWIPTGIVVFLAALSVNLMGDALNEAVDPRSQER